MNIYTKDSIFIFLGFMVVLYLAGIIIYQLTNKIREKTRYIKLEINRNTGDKKSYWKKELKRHKLRSIPLIGKWLERIIFD